MNAPEPHLDPELAKQTLANAGMFQMSPASATMGWQFVSLDPKGNFAEVIFEAKPEFANPTGMIQGGMLAAMLDDVIGMLGFLKAGKGAVAGTIDLHVHYFRPVRPGAVRVRADITQKGRSTMFGEATLFDSRGKPAAKASSSLAIMKISE